MSFRFALPTLLAIAGALSMGSVLAAEAIDPHQRARERIVPPVLAASPAPAGAMGRVVEAGAFVDPHVRAQRALRDDGWLQAQAGATVAALVPAAHADAHAHIRARIVGRGE